jgi:hypothetical protein
MRRVLLARVQRHIPPVWLSRAKALLEALVAASPLQRARLIRRNASFWSELRETLWRVGGEKCWYSEVLLPLGEAEVEHFRPKGRLSGEQHAGYWWLAFEWRNYRVASHLVNARKFDPLNYGHRGKGSYFPLIGGPRAVYSSNSGGTDPLCIKCERPLLLDPTDANDVCLLTFDQDGNPVPNLVACLSDHAKQRVLASISYYHLDDGVLTARRADRWKQVFEWSEEVETLVSATDVRCLSDDEKNRLERLLNQIADSIDKAAEFSGVALATLMVRGDRGWNTCLVTSSA